MPTCERALQQTDQSANQADREVQEFEPVEQRDPSNERLGIAGASENREQAGKAQRERGEVEREEGNRRQRSAGPAVTPLRKDLREVEEHRRERKNRDGVRPIEHPVEPIEPAAEREREHPEKGDRQPEEVKRCRIAGTAQPDGASDQQGENSNRGEHEIERARTIGYRGEPEIENLARAETKNGVAQRSLIGASLVQDIEDVSRALNGAIVDGEQQIASRQTNTIGRASSGHFIDDGTIRPRRPQHAVFDFLPRRARGDVGNAQAEQGRHDDHRQSWSRPSAPCRRQRGKDPRTRTCHPT